MTSSTEKDPKSEESLRQRLVEKSHEQTSIRGHEMDRATLFRFVGLIAFLAIMVVIVIAVWPYVADVSPRAGSSAWSTACAMRALWAC